MPKKPLFASESASSEARRLRARLVSRLNREYLRGAIGLEEFEHELDAIKNYEPIPHEEGD
jgi:hypothetical protein